MISCRDGIHPNHIIVIFTTSAYKLSKETGPCCWGAGGREHCWGQWRRGLAARLGAQTRPGCWRALRQSPRSRSSLWNMLRDPRGLWPGQGEDRTPSVARWLAEAQLQGLRSQGQPRRCASPVLAQCSCNPGETSQVLECTCACV